MSDVFVVGAGATHFGRRGGTPADLTYEATVAALSDARLAPAEVPAVFAGCRGDAAAPGAAALMLRLGLRRAGVAGADHERAEHLSASAARALHLAWSGVESGLFDVALCVGAATAPGGPDDGAAELLAERADAARRYLAASGGAPRHLALVAAKNRRHGTRNPIACAGDELTADDVLAHDVLAWPLTGPMVARPASGAAAVVLASGRLRRRLGGWPVRVRASVLAAGAPIDDVAARAVTLAYRLAGLGPDDLDCAEVHDDSAAAELGSYEALGLVPAGHGPELIDSGFTALGGVLPVNPSGGLLALGEADGATALAQICELAAQLRGDAGPRQVPAARVALALGLGPDEEHGDRRVAGVALLTAT